MSMPNCSWASGADCSWSPNYWRGQCLQEVPGSRVGDVDWAQCVLNSCTQFEQSVLAQRQYILTLWPTFIGFICSFGPDPADFVCDNVWWAVLFAVTCGGLPGLDTRKPRHYMSIDWLEEARQICQFHPHDIDPKYSGTIPRSFGRPNVKRIQAIVRIEWITYLFSWACYIAFAVNFALAVNQSVVYSVPIRAGVSTWYWLSAGPAVLVLCSEALQNRVELFEPDAHISATNKIIDTQEDCTSTLLSIGSAAATRVRREQESVTIRDHQKSVDAAQADPRALYQKTHSKSFFYLWSRIAYLQFTRRSYRVLLRPEDDRWFFLCWKLLVNLSRVTLFAWGSAIMGGIILFPQPNDLALVVLMLFLTAIPRMLFFGIWRNKARGADLVVVCNQLAIGQEASITQTSLGVSKAKDMQESHS